MAGDTKGGSSFHTTLSDGKKSAEKFMETAINNNSAVIDNFTKAIEQLKKVSGNPTAIESIGAGNYSAIQSQLAQHFSPQEVKPDEPGLTPCDMLFKIPFALLTDKQAYDREHCIWDCEALHRALPENLSPEEVEAKAVCEVVRQRVDDEIAGIVDVTAPSFNANTEFANPQSGLSLTLEAMTHETVLKAYELNANLSGNTVINGNVYVGGLATFGNATITVNSSTILVGNSISNTLVNSSIIMIGNTTINSTAFAINGSLVGAALSRGTVSAATLDIPLSDYSSFFGCKIVLSLLPGTNSQDLWMRFSTDGGSSYVASGYNYTVHHSTPISAVPFDVTVNSIPPASGDSSVVAPSKVGSASDTKIRLTGNTIGNAASAGVNLTIELVNFANTTMHPRVHWTGYGVQSGGTGLGFTGGGALATAQDTDAIRFLFASGNVIGTYAVYGY